MNDKQALKTRLRTLENEIGRSSALYQNRRAALQSSIEKKQQTIRELDSEWNMLNERYQTRLDELRDLLQEKECEPNS